MLYCLDFRNFWLVAGLILTEAVVTTFTMNSTSNTSTSSESPSSSDVTPSGPSQEVIDTLNITNHVIVGIGFLICIIAIFGNSCVIYLVVSKRRMRNVTNYFIASLALSDIMIAVVCIPFSFTANVLFTYWPYGSGLCPILNYFQLAVVFQNAYTFLAMSAERYIAIVHPFLQRLGKRRCLQIVVVCWVLAFLTPLPSAITSKMNYHQDYPNETGYYLCYEVWEYDNQRFAYSVTILVLQFFLPVVVLVFTYARIVHVIWLKDMPTPAVLMSQNKEQKEVVKVKEADPRKKVIKMMITVVGIYIICWLPLHLLTIAMDVNPNLQNWPYMQLTWTSFLLLALSTCMYNPFIYWWMNPKFAEGYKTLYTRFKARITCQPLDDDFLDLGTSVGTSKRFFSTGYTTTMDFNDRRPSSSTQVEYSILDGGGTAMEKLLPKDSHLHHHQNSNGNGIKDTELRAPPLSDITESQEDGVATMNSRQ